ncbi:MFS transporter [Paenarthrobacter sp. 22069]|uniref:MFS transporter n=1 Tax=Paenarthrobacter sp. 22069 TaxID=3453864 RepID=UPI003F84A5A3
MSIPNTETTATSDEATPLTTEQSGKGGTQRRTAVRWKLFLLLLVLVSVNYIDRGSISVALPIIQKEFNLPPELVGLLLSAFFWTYALMQVPVGWLIDKFGPRKVMTASCLGWGAATAASGMAGGFLSMFIARLGIGVTEAGGDAGRRQAQCHLDAQVRTRPRRHHP